jgi:hypothetical protein
MFLYEILDAMSALFIFACIVIQDSIAAIKEII